MKAGRPESQGHFILYSELETYLTYPRPSCNTKSILPSLSLFFLFEDCSGKEGVIGDTVATPLWLWGNQLEHRAVNRSKEWLSLNCPTWHSLWAFVRLRMGSWTLSPMSTLARKSESLRLFRPFAGSPRAIFQVPIPLPGKAYLDASPSFWRGKEGAGAGVGFLVYRTCLLPVWSSRLSRPHCHPL